MFFSAEDKGQVVREVELASTEQAGMVQNRLQLASRSSFGEHLHPPYPLHAFDTCPPLSPSTSISVQAAMVLGLAWE